MATEKTAFADSTLKCIVFMGSNRVKPTPWGKHMGDTGRLGDRVLEYLKSRVTESNKKNTKLEIEVFDTTKIPVFQKVMQSPCYYLNKTDVPAELQDLEAKVKAADCYIVVTPEYNHTIPPALTNMMDYFGCSLYSYKPSGCVCYSMTGAGGSRVAQALRPFLSELGCLPVSKQVIIQNCFKVLKADGTPAEGLFPFGEKTIAETLDRQMDGLLRQLIWWAEACYIQRAAKGPP